MAKGPKVLNPADKARKEARKKELKKNKKQRQQVRSAAIEGRDPERIISDLENLDKLEFDIEKDTSSTSETLFKDKRKRLKESWTRILDYYEKEDPEKHAKLKKLESEYENKHKILEKDFEAMKAAREVKIEDIFLPPEPNTDLDEITEDDPLMSETIYINPLIDGIKPPGCPPGLPPDLGQLVDSLKNSLAAPMPQPLPQNLLNLASLQRRKNQDRRERYPPREPRVDRPPGGRAVKSNPSTSSKKDTPVKAAVIESKPVIFLQKATKFVPASVRPKISQSNAKKSPSA